MLTDAQIVALFLTHTPVKADALPLSETGEVFEACAWTQAAKVDFFLRCWSTTAKPS
jgi:hypothetical protein